MEKEAKTVSKSMNDMLNAVCVVGVNFLSMVFIVASVVWGCYQIIATMFIAFKPIF